MAGLEEHVLRLEEITDEVMAEGISIRLAGALAIELIKTAPHFLEIPEEGTEE